MKFLITASQLLLCGALIQALGGCATKPFPVGIRTESHSAAGIRIISVNLACDDKGLLVAGHVAKQPGAILSNTIYRHLDIEVVCPDGRPVLHQAIKFHPNQIPSSRRGAAYSSYSLRLEHIPKPGSKICVTVHADLLSRCQFGTGECHYRQASDNTTPM